MRLVSQGGTLIFPLAGWKGDKSTSQNPNFGLRAVMWTDDNTGMNGGWARTNSIIMNGSTAGFSATSLQMEGFASLRCVKK